MKTNIITKAVLALALIAGFSSCQNRLNIPQHEVLNYETYYQTDEEANSAVLAIYTQINGAKFNFHLILNSMGDDFWSGGGGRNDNADLEQFNEFTYGVEAGYVQGLFQSYYQIINKCNVVIGHIAPETPVKTQCVAEAKAIRAWTYFNLINLWGTPPIVDHELTPSEYSRPNATKEELWAFVEKDLNEAIEAGLPEKTDVNDNVTWRVTKQFAQAVLGKALMWQGKYKAAAKEFHNVINCGKYELFAGLYGDMLGYNQKHNCESMFESNRVTDPNRDSWTNFDMGAVMCHWRIDKMNAPADYSGLVSDQGWGFLCPQKSLYDDFVEVEGER